MRMDKDREIFKDLEEIEKSGLEEEEETHEGKYPSWLKKASLIAGAFFIILLLIVNTNAGYHLISLASGRIVSADISSDYSIEIKYGGKVFLDEKIFSELSSIYAENQGKEFKVCITGRKEGKDYHADGMYIPKIFSQSVYSVTSEMCNTKTIISLHSHPPLRCLFSQQDIQYYNIFKRSSPDAIIGLMCGPKRFSFFGYES